MNILFIANLVPFPLDGGGKIKTFTSIKALAKEHTIDLVCFYEKENIDDAKKALGEYCRNIIMLPIRVTTSENKKYIARKALECLFTTRSLSIHKYYQDDMKCAIISLIRKNIYDVAYFNILQMYSYKKIIKKNQPRIKTVLDTQNCEALIFKRNADTCHSIIKKAYLQLESYKLGRFESKAVQDADELILLSKEDKHQLETMAGTELKATIIPIGVDDPKWKKEIRDINDEFRILFLGTLTWAPNNDGMIWFMEKVMPRLVKEKFRIKLYIVGKNPSEKLKALAREYGDKVIITGYVESVEDYYKLCDFTIVPLFFGSGQRVKIIEGFAHGMPIISTKIGAEGLYYKHGENIMIADDSDGFLKAIYSMDSKELRLTLSNNSRQTYLSYYSPEAIETQLNKVIANAVNRR